MGWFLTLMGIIWVADGVLLLTIPSKMKHLVVKMLEMKNPKPLGVLPLLFGILFFFSTQNTTLPWLIVILGILALIKAAYIFLVPVERLRNNWWLKQPLKMYRVFGVVALILGVVVLFTRA